MITVTAFKWVPPAVQGLVCDLRVRWALEEAGMAYETILIGPDDQSRPDYRARQPFGQVPVYEEDGLVLFETGSIILHIGARSRVLLPADEAAKARAVTWMFAALDSMWPSIQQLAVIDLFHAGEDWAASRRPAVEQAVRQRLSELATWLGDKAYLEGDFTAGDLMMTTVLRNLRHTDLVAAEPNLKVWLARCEARPAFQRALNGQMAVFEAA
jgi:glutathione S-transferase